MCAPAALISFITVASPFLLMVLSASVESFIVTQRSSSAKKKRLVCKFGKNLRLVFMFEWETLWPRIGFLPVTWHTLAMTVIFSDGKGRENQPITKTKRSFFKWVLHSIGKTTFLCLIIGLLFTYAFHIFHVKNRKSPTSGLSSFLF